MTQRNLFSQGVEIFDQLVNTAVPYARPLDKINLPTLAKVLKLKIHVRSPEVRVVVGRFFAGGSGQLRQACFAKDGDLLLEQGLDDL